jgi:S1-C subfamily serine protease
MEHAVLLDYCPLRRVSLEWPEATENHVHGENVAMNRGWRIAMATVALAASQARMSMPGGPLATRAAATGNLADLAGAICPVVYPVDETPGAHGYQFIFYGNAFFVNADGYLLTAAHVLHSFGDGGQPYVLLARAEAPPQMVKVEVVAVEKEHDVAILRATPNPFRGGYRVRVLALHGDGPARGQDVFVAAMRPSRRRPSTFEAELQDRADARVLDYASSQLDKGSGDTDLFLFSHEVILGQSGAPVLSASGLDVVGFVEGQWLHPMASMVAATGSGASTVGAAVPIRYAIAVLKEKGIAWGQNEVAK